ncbi:MAG: PKD domain-containing protein [Cyclobacteriaceae bacterium]|nr:PKD domain-containing protein [Cyclobacteriaceae bacterium]
MKMRLFLSLVGCLMLVAYSHSFAQSVDPLTGRLQFSLPIATISANDIAIPVTLYHTGSSVPVPTGNGSVGIGWNLNVGGAVTRVVHGLPDEVNTPTRKGWLHNNNATAIQNLSLIGDDNFSVCTDEGTDFNTLEGIVGSMINDTEPDMYYISAPGLSAQFIFGTNGLPVLIEPQPIIVQYGENTITVTGANGLTYTFSNKENVTRKANGNSVPSQLNTDARYYSESINYPVRWLLSSITSSITTTTANFNYDTNEEISNSRFYLVPDSSSYVDDTFSRKKLISISLKSYQANFTWENDLLTKVTVSESTTATQTTTQLLYASVSNSPVYPKPKITRALLHKILLSPGSAPYEFEYYSLPSQVWNNNWGMDFFGFYNEVLSNNNDVKLYFYANESDGKRLRVVPIPGLTATTITGGADRNVNTTSFAGALSKILLPTGGYVKIDYETNRYWDSSVNQELLGGGIRVKKITSQGSEIAFGKTLNTASAYRAVTKEYEYKLDNSNNSSGVLVAPVNLGYITHAGIQKSVATLGEEPDIYYTRVTEKVSGQGKTVYEFSVPGVFPEITNGIWKATKSRIARMAPTGGNPCLPVGEVKNGYYSFPFPPSSNYRYKRGFLTRVSEYAEGSSTPIRERIYTPQELTKNPAIIKGLRFERLNGNIYYYGVYEIITGRTQVVLTEVNKESSIEAPALWMQTTKQYTYNSNNFLQTISTTLPDGTVTEKKIKYASDFAVTAPAANDTMAIALKKLNELNLKGQVVEEITKIVRSGISTAYSASLILYRDWGNNRVLPYYALALKPRTLFTEAYLNGQAFTRDVNYRVGKIFKHYDAEGRLLTEIDYTGNAVGYHYAINRSVPVATFALSRAQQAIYEGFEEVTSFGLSVSGSGVNYTPGWTGTKSIEFTNNSVKIVSSPTATNLIEKAGNTYRFSCWVYSPANKKIFIEVKQGATIVANEITNTVNNAWTYYEKSINLSAISAPFTLEVKTDAGPGSTVRLDDVVFLPDFAKVSIQQSKPFAGITYASDDRGNSARQDYDVAGKPILTYDRNRNLTSKIEYITKVKPIDCLPSASFGRSTPFVMLGDPVTFTAANTCGVAIAYQWEVDGQLQSGANSSSFAYTFQTFGQHSITLTITSSGNSTTTFTDSFCVEVDLVLNAYDVNSVLVNNYTFDCNSNNLPITLQLGGLGSFASSYEILWYEILYDQIRDEYRPEALLNGSNQHYRGFGLTSITQPLSATRTFMAQVRHPNTSSLCAGALTTTRTLTFVHNPNCY